MGVLARDSVSIYDSSHPRSLRRVFVLLGSGPSGLPSVALIVKSKHNVPLGSPRADGGGVTLWNSGIDLKYFSAGLRSLFWVVCVVGAAGLAAGKAQAEVAAECKSRPRRLEFPLQQEMARCRLRGTPALAQRVTT